MKLNRQELRRLRRLSDSELAIEATARLMLPVVMGNPDADTYEERQDARDNADGPEEDREWEVRD